MKKFTLLTLTALMASSVLLNGCGLAKSSQEEYAELCKQYEPYYAFTIVQNFYKTVDKSLYNTEKEHAVLENCKKHLYEGEKIFNQMQKIASSNTEIMSNFQMNYLYRNNTPEEAKRQFNIAADEHRKFHKGCTYDFKF